MVTTLCAFAVVLETFQNTPSVVLNEDGTTGTELSLLQRLWTAILVEKLTFAFGGFTLLCAWSLTSLLCFHGVIISIAQTTNERVRGVYRFGQAENAADSGCVQNWFTACCTPVPVSRLPTNMSEQVIADYENRPESVWNNDEEEGGEGRPAAKKPDAKPAVANTGLNGGNGGTTDTKDKLSSSTDKPVAETKGEAKDGEISKEPAA